MITNVTDKDFFAYIAKGFNKTVVAVTKTNGDSRYTGLVTRNKAIINLFNGGLADFDFIDNTEFDVYYVYDLLLDQVIPLTMTRDMYCAFIALPFEIPPPLLIHPNLENTISEETVVNTLAPFLNLVKKFRDEGRFSDVPITNEERDIVYTAYNFISKGLGIDTSTFSEFDSFNNQYSTFFVENDIKIRETLARIHKILFFLPAIIESEKAAAPEKDIQPKDILLAILSNNLFTNLKSNWICFLNQQKEKNIAEKTESLNKLDAKFQAQLSSEIRAYLSQALPGTPSVALANYAPVIAAFLADNLNYITSSACTPPENIFNTLQQAVNFTQPFIEPLIENNYSVVTGLLQHCNNFYEEFTSIRDQYHLVLTELKDLNIENELAEYNDYRLYFRYWPDAFDVNDAIHNALRPFTALENFAVKTFINEGIPFNVDAFYRGEADYYNAVIDILQNDIDKVRSVRLDQIKKVSEERAAEIKAEISPMYDALADEEKEQFNTVINDLINHDKYQKELQEIPRLIDVLAYWPVSLYPIPDNILQI